MPSAIADMSPQELNRRVLQLVTDVAPDIDPATVRPDRNLRDQFDFDSMDMLHFATAISREFGIDVAEQEYSRLASIGKACDYVREKLTRRGSGDAAP